MAERAFDMQTVALYLRLSREEADREESLSIENQRQMLRAFVKEHLPEDSIREFCDDGCSGTTTERAGFLQMIACVKKGEVQTIVVKDFSRFSRDYIVLGEYLSGIFPALGVRFISVLDRYDGAREEDVWSVCRPFGYLFCDLYSKDISKKVRQSLRARKEQGRYAMAGCPFGYRKGTDGTLKVEETEAAVIRMIFAKYVQGMSAGCLAEWLNEQGIPTPLRAKQEQGGCRQMPKGGQYLWSASYICRILKNPVYTGTFVYGKYETPAVGEKKRLRQEKDWIRIPNHHEPIIERELFEQAQKSRAHGKRKTDGISHFLTGKVLCAGCKRNLRFRKTAEPYFCCQSRTGRAGTACVRKLPVSHLENVLLQELIRMKREQKLPVRAWCDSRKRMLAEEEELQQKQLQKQKHRLGRYRRQLFEAYLQKEPVSVADPCIQSCMQEIRMCTQQIRQIQNSRQQLQMWQEQEIFPPDGVLKQQFLDRFLDHISVQADGTIHIFWKPYQENKVSGEPEIPEALDDGCIRKTFL